MKTPTKVKENGIVAILDALGASTYGETEIQRFIESRQQVLALLKEKALDVLGTIKKEMITTFTFNDTILVVLRTGESEPTLKLIANFFTIMRKFFVDSLQHGILFRGSIAVGEFYANDETNTVLGKAVTDAAAWYDKADWIGIHATPRTSMIIQKWIEKTAEGKDHVLLGYDVPMKQGMPVNVKAVNWPKVFFVGSITPCKHGEKEEEKLLEFLTAHQVPAGTERKFSNTLAFFRHAANLIPKDEKEKARRRQ